MGWKIYFWFFLVLVAATYALLFSYKPTVWEFFDLIISSVAIIGLFLYAYKKKLLTPNFWKYWLILLVLWDVMYNFLLSDYLGIAQRVEGGEEGNSLDLIVGWLFVLPLYIALYFLAFKSGHLWQGTHSATQDGNAPSAQDQLR